MVVNYFNTLQQMLVIERQSYHYNQLHFLNKESS